MKASLLLKIGFWFWVLIRVSYGFDNVMFEDNADVTQKNLNFEEGAVVQGLDANPFVSLTNAEMEGSNASGHLYHLKPHFNLEIEEQALQIGFTGCNP